MDRGSAVQTDSLRESLKSSPPSNGRDGALVSFREAELPKNFLNVTIDGLKPIPLGISNLALAITRNGVGINAELLTPSGSVRHWQIGTEMAPFEGGELALEKTALSWVTSGRTLAIDARKWLTSAHISISFDPGRNVVLVNLNSDLPWPIKL